MSFPCSYMDIGVRLSSFKKNQHKDHVPNGPICTFGLVDLQWLLCTRILQVQFNEKFRSLNNDSSFGLFFTSKLCCMASEDLECLPDSHSDNTSRKFGLRERFRGLRVPFGIGPVGIWTYSRLKGLAR